MGWNSWNYFGCDVTAADVKAAADAIVSDGLVSLGYRYVNVDDCWQAPTRDSQERLRGDPVRFPDGIAALAAYVHSKGLKFGLYAAPGSRTCAERYQGYPGRLGSIGHVQQDARTFAGWKVDYLKYDWCGADKEHLGHEQAFAQMRAALNATGRHIVFSIHDKPEQPTPSWRAHVSDLSRTTPDIQDSFASVISITRATARVPGLGAQGHWNDPDMLEIGNGGMTVAEERTHFSLWAQLAAPLLLGCDLRTAPPDAVAIAGNASVIRVDQDALGVQGHIVKSAPGTLVLTKALAGGDSAVTVTNLTEHQLDASIPMSELGLNASATGVELWTGARVASSTHPTVELAAHATVMYRFTAASAPTD
jgi:alpha-galactosidase